MIAKSHILLACSVLALAAQSAHGQEMASDTAQNSAQPDGEIIVTGTRISSFNAPTPVTSLGEVELEQKAIATVSELMADLPSLRVNQNTGQTSEPIGASNLDLRALGPARTLVLIDGRRVAATDPTGTFDTNIIPAILMKRIEIVTGGASAAYGSDAVAGVVQIFLDDRLTGLKADIQKGISTYGDVAVTAGSLAAGRGFADGRFHIVGAVDYYDNKGQLNQDSRPWGRDNYALVTNPAGNPDRVTAANARFSQLTYGGVTALNSPAPLRGLQFGPGGTVLPFNYGQYVGTLFMVGGDGDTLAGTANIFPEIRRMSGFGKATFDLTDAISIYADALVSKIDIFSNGATARDNGTLTIRRDNAFLPQQIANILTANRLTSFRIGRLSGEEGQWTNAVDSEVQRYGAGIRGDFSANWHWDAGIQLFRNKYHREDGNNRNLQRFAYGVDSILVNGQPVCRIKAQNPTSTDPNIANCVPINVFGAGSISQQALDYYVGTAVLDSKQKQDLYFVNLNGPLFNTWAGAVELAVGAEYRRDEIDASSDPVSRVSGYTTVNPQPLSGGVGVKEAYAEIVVPLLNDQPLGHLLDVNGAVRMTDYSTSGTVTTWKVGMNYAPVADLRFRGTYSRDIRAPSVNELFSGQNQIVRNLVDPRDNSNPTVRELVGGNPDLKPETSKAWTVGAVYSPSWANRLRLSFDYYSFKIADAIVSLSGQQIVDGCFRLNQPSLCGAITEGGGSITEVAATLINAGQFATKGFDVAAEYSIPVGNGAVQLRGLATYVDNLTTTVNNVPTDQAGQVGRLGGVPTWRGNVSARYVGETFTFGVLARYVDGGTYQSDFVEGVDIDDNSIPSITYFDLDMTTRINSQFELYAKINNLFNVDPPLAPQPISAPNYNGSPFHDTIGRYFKIGARLNF